MDVIAYFKLAKHVFHGCLREPWSLLNREGAMGKEKRPQGKDANLGGYPKECTKCGLVFFPKNQKDASCPFCG
ncbi:MAG: hypothetical protein QME75_04915 [Deltaproteobacteria bacterium]|nr:hypothetical protein [Deltaproteobacteria bacterium]